MHAIHTKLRIKYSFWIPIFNGRLSGSIYQNAECKSELLHKLYFLHKSTRVLTTAPCVIVLISRRGWTFVVSVCRASLAVRAQTCAPGWAHLMLLSSIWNLEGEFQYGGPSGENPWGLQWRWEATGVQPASSLAGEWQWECWLCPASLVLPSSSLLTLPSNQFWGAPIFPLKYSSA